MKKHSAHPRSHRIQPSLATRLTRALTRWGRITDVLSQRIRASEHLSAADYATRITRPR